MRLAIGGFNLESVTFLPHPTTLNDFEGLAKRGQELISSFEGTNTVPGGFIEECREKTIDIVPLVYSEAGAAASATDEAFNHFLTEISDGILKCRDQLDGVLLGLHGALVTLSGKTDLDFILELRNRIGTQIPIGVSFDLHGNLDPKLADIIDVMSAYHESPHIDMAKTGQRVANLLIGKIDQTIEPSTIIRKVPITLPSIFTATTVSPLLEIMEEARKRERNNKALLDCSIVMGFAYADVPQIGISILITVDNDMEIAMKTANEMAILIWDQRDSLYPKNQILSVSSGLLEAKQSIKRPGKPVVILEHADRMNDSTYVLKELLNLPGIRSAAPYFWDPVAAEIASKSPIGSTVTLTIGGHSSTKAGDPIIVTARVLWTGEPNFFMGGEMGKGRPISLGPTAVIEAQGVVIWLISLNISAINLDPFEQFGFNHKDFDIVLLRSKTHFRAVWEAEAEKIIIVDTPDWGPGLLDTLTYQNARPGVFPIT